MTTNKKPLTFYPSDGVVDWIYSMPTGERSRNINNALEVYLKNKPPGSLEAEVIDLRERVAVLEEIQRRSQPSTDNAKDYEIIQSLLHGLIRNPLKQS